MNLPRRGNVTSPSRILPACGMISCSLNLTNGGNVSLKSHKMELISRETASASHLENKQKTAGSTPKRLTTVGGPIKSEFFSYGKYIYIYISNHSVSRTIDFENPQT
ncbi:hypothetical protein CEXT_560111 [Caerostris extrusa]|uniref:Uncharacterized protein n=1 Tax=Caerostris extrusa TaxID=172846 RepID=A0AAV4XQ39_CAEEX|nr:hypothetical protein CEXT_560111 [Caerostris extrusa]